MNWRDLPSLNSLRAFCAVAESGSFKAAAQHLNVTQAAVSQQVKLLEARIGLPLLARAGRGVVLTADGTALARDLEHGFSTIMRGVERLSDSALDRPVQITMSPAFAVEWLLPRIPEFQQAHPEIPLMLSPTGQLLPLKAGGIDVAIRYRDKRRPVDGLQTLLLSDMIVIGTPELVGDLDIQGPEDLVDLPWLQELGTNEASEWFTLHGVVPDRPLNITHMPGNLIMNAVRHGDGLTYTARAFFERDLAAGRMVELFSKPTFGIYHVELQNEPLRPAVRTFLNWLMPQAETITRP